MNESEPKKQQPFEMGSGEEIKFDQKTQFNEQTGKFELKLSWKANLFRGRIEIKIIDTPPDSNKEKVFIEESSLGEKVLTENDLGFSLSNIAVSTTPVKT